MQETEFLPDDTLRFDVRHAHRILDDLPEQPYDDLVQLAALVCATPMATIALVDKDRLWRKSGIGLPSQVNPAARDDAFAAWVVRSPEQMTIVEDTHQDARFVAHPFVTGSSAVRFYAGVAIISDTAGPVGALGVMDVVPRQLSAEQRAGLQRLARQVAALLEVRRRSEREAGQVYRENQYLQALTLTGLDLQSVVDRHYRYRHVNQVYLDYWQKRRADIEGKTVAELIGEEHFQNCVKGYLDRAMAGEQISVDAMISYPEKGERFVRTSFLPASNRLGDVIGAVIRVEDLSDLKEIEMSLRHTVHLLEEKKQDLQRFIYILSHDLREPVNTILNFSALLREQSSGAADAQSGKFLEFIYKGGDRMRSLLEDLLKYVRVDSNQPDVAQVSLDELFQEVKQDLAAALQRTHALLLAGKLPVITADRNMLRVLLQNLIENAIKFVAPGVVPRVQVEARLEEDYWRITVTDNGVGMREEQREVIFELFKRLHSRKQYEGTGLGLATCRRIAELHGGKIWVTGDVHGGSCFHVQLPYRK